MNKSLRQIAKELNISCGYLSDILNGKKGCSYELINKIQVYKPNIIIEKNVKIRYKVIGVYDE